jgi:hypothetical protein
MFMLKKLLFRLKPKFAMLNAPRSFRQLERLLGGNTRIIDISGRKFNHYFFGRDSGGIIPLTR